MEADTTKYFEKLGKRYAKLPFEDPLYENIPPMTYDERLAFNRGYQKGLDGPSLPAKLFVAGLAIVVILAIVGFVK